MSLEDDKPKGSEVIDAVSQEWGKIIDGWRKVQQSGAPNEFSHLKALLLLKAEKSETEKTKAKLKIVTTIGSANPRVMEAIARNDDGNGRNKLPALATAIFEPTTGPVIYTQELQFSPVRIDDFSSRIVKEGYHALRVSVRDDTKSIVVSYITKDVDTPPEVEMASEFIPISTLSENPKAVIDTMNTYFHLYAPGGENRG